MKIIHINFKSKVRDGLCTYPALQTKMQLKTKELLKKSDAYSEKTLKVTLYCLFEIVFPFFLR